MRKKVKKTQITNIRNESDTITMDSTNSKRLMWECYKHLCQYKFDNLDEWENSC